MIYSHINQSIKDGITLEKEHILSLDAFEFEHYIAKMFNNLGYKTNVTSKTNDGGKDLIIERYGQVFYVQCKHYLSPNNIQRPEIQRIVGAAHADNVDGCFMVTSSDFSYGAREEALKTGVYLMDLDDIAYSVVFPYGYNASTYNCSISDKKFFLKYFYEAGLKQNSICREKNLPKEKLARYKQEPIARKILSKEQEINKNNLTNKSDIQEDKPVGAKETKKNLQWYYHPLLVGWLFVMCMPLGVFLWWRSDYFGNTIKRIMLGITLALFFYAGICGLFHARAIEEFIASCAIILLVFAVLWYIFKDIKNPYDSYL